MEGVIRSVVPDKFYGFIKSGDTDYFFHSSGFGKRFTTAEFKSLKGRRVQFEPVNGEGNKGPRAENVSFL